MNLSVGGHFHHPKPFWINDLDLSFGNVSNGLRRTDLAQLQGEHNAFYYRQKSATVVWLRTYPKKEHSHRQVLCDVLRTENGLLRSVYPRPIVQAGL